MAIEKVHALEKQKIPFVQLLELYKSNRITALKQWIAFGKGQARTRSTKGNREETGSCSYTVGVWYQEYLYLFSLSHFW